MSREEAVEGGVEAARVEAEAMSEMVPCPSRICFPRFQPRNLCQVCGGPGVVRKDIAAIFLGLRQPIKERIGKN